MKTNNTGKKSAVTLNHISGTKVHTPDSAKNDDNRSGAGNTSCIFIFIKDRLFSGKNLLVKAFNKYKFEPIKDNDISDRYNFFKGRELHMRTGEFPGSMREYSYSSGDSSAFDRKISVMFRRFSAVIRGFSGFVRIIPGALRNSSGRLGNFSGLYSKIPGLFYKLPDIYRKFSGLHRYFSGSFLVFSEIFRNFPGLFRGFSEGSGERLKRI